jgi:hypothetical protein
MGLGDPEREVERPESISLIKVGDLHYVIPGS